MKITIVAPGGTSCSCGTWLDHWNKFSGQSAPVHCPNLMCTDRTDTGAHVQKEGNTQVTYILPLCAKHAAQVGESFAINDYLPLVSTNLAETCAKPQSKPQSTSA